AIWPYLNRKALTRGQWQMKRGSRSESEHDAWLAEHADPVMDRLSLQCLQEKILQPKVVYGWFRCRGEGDDLVVLDEDGRTELERFSFPRQAERRRLCISDFFGEDDVIGMSCVTVGEEATARCKSLFESGDFSEYLYLHGFAVETAEALAELWHKRMRAELGIDADDAVAPEELFRQQYRGSRYSFGYPACPDMADQTKLFRLLHPERIGCRLTENHQIDPEQSTSAIVVHHPEAKYFAL
ncbi:MAG: vitamin B12 dependent-methionine synthase activation domain-containing protein, partial [Planctomycetota bacterium]|nr:vitamin B12 dependent-methionine synthase activation domain-containing protein [Planctomycetota bacterium]